MKKPDLFISQASAQDIELFVDFQQQMGRETENVNLSAEILRQGLLGLFEKPERGTYWCVEWQGQKVGCFMTMGEWSEWRNGTVLWIHSVYVLSQFRGKGIFRGIYVYLQEMVNNSNEYRGLRLYVDKRNERASKIYAKLGMNNEHYEMFEWLKDS